MVWPFGQKDCGPCSNTENKTPAHSESRAETERNAV